MLKLKSNLILYYAWKKLKQFSDINENNDEHIMIFDQLKY